MFGWDIDNNQMTKKYFIVIILQITVIVGGLVYMVESEYQANVTLTAKNKLLRRASANYRVENITLQKQVLQLQQFDFHTVMVCLLNESRKQKIPVNISLALAGIESGFSPSAVSVTGDFGLMQINAKSHPECDVNKLLIPAYNISEGLRILRECYDRAGNWSLSFAIYNAGRNHARSNHQRKLSESEFYGGNK